MTILFKDERIYNKYMLQDVGEPIRQRVARPLSLEVGSRDTREHFLKSPKVDYIIAPSGAVNVDLLKTAAFDDLVTRLAVMRIIQVEQIPQSVLVDVIEDISAQVREDTKGSHISGEEFTRLCHSGDAITNLLANYRRNPQIPFPQAALRMIKDLRVSSPSQNQSLWELQYIEQSNVAKLIVLDERNGEMGGERLGIKEEVEGEILSELRSMTERLPLDRHGFPIYPDNTERRALAYTIACGKAATTGIMYQFLQENQSIPVGFLQVFGNALGFETMRANINTFVKAHPQAREKIEALVRAVGLDKGEQIFFDLGDFYKAVNLEGYLPYEQLQETDIKFLLEQLQGRQKVVDVGCGRGRHMIPLLMNGISVEGVEINLDSVPAISAQASNAIVHEGSMNNLPFEDASVDGIYMMGRTSAHISDVMEAIAVFQEFKRVLKNDGIVLLDVPSLSSKEMRQNRSQRSQFLWDKLHIWHTETGTIHDTPDGRHFIDRSVLNVWQVDAIARLAGFDAEIVQEVPYRGALGEDAVNIYWKLTDRKFGSDNVGVNEMEPLAHTSFGKKGVRVDIDSN